MLFRRLRLAIQGHQLVAPKFGDATSAENSASTFSGDVKTIRPSSQLTAGKPSFALRITDARAALWQILSNSAGGMSSFFGSTRGMGWIMSLVLWKSVPTFLVHELS